MNWLCQSVAPRRVDRLMSLRRRDESGCPRSGACYVREGDAQRRCDPVKRRFRPRQQIVIGDEDARRGASVPIRREHVVCPDHEAFPGRKAVPFGKRRGDLAWVSNHDDESRLILRGAQRRFPNAGQDRNAGILQDDRPIAGIVGLQAIGRPSRSRPLRRLFLNGGLRRRTCRASWSPSTPAACR